MPPVTQTAGVRRRVSDPIAVFGSNGGRGLPLAQQMRAKQFAYSIDPTQT